MDLIEKIKIELQDFMREEHVIISLILLIILKLF